MRLQWVACDIDSRFHRSDAVVHDQSHWDFAQTHSNHFADANRRTGNARPQPRCKKFEKNNDQNEADDGDDGEADEIKRFHGGNLFVRTLLGKFNHHEVAVKGSGETVPSGDATLRFGGAGPEGLAEKTTVNTRELAPLG